MLLDCTTRGCFKELKMTSKWRDYTFGVYRTAKCPQCTQLYWVYARKGQRWKKKDRKKGSKFEERNR